MDTNRLVRIGDFVLSLVQTVAIIVALMFSVQGFKASQAQMSAETMIKFDDRLNSPTDRKIWIAIAHDRPILKENKGKFSTDDLDDFLGDLQTLADAYELKVIDLDTTCAEFSDQVYKTLKDPEIAAYLAKVRREDDMYFRGIEDLKDAFDKSQCSHPG